VKVRVAYGSGGITVLVVQLAAHSAVRQYT